MAQRVVILKHNSINTHGQENETAKWIKEWSGGALNVVFKSVNTPGGGTADAAG